MDLPVVFWSCIPNVGIGSYIRCRITSKNAFEKWAKEYAPILSRQRSPELGDQDIHNIAAKHAECRYEEQVPSACPVR
jgi:hypothetical protein